MPPAGANENLRRPVSHCYDPGTSVARTAVAVGKNDRRNQGGGYEIITYTRHCRPGSFPIRLENFRMNNNNKKKKSKINVNLPYTDL